MIGRFLGYFVDGGWVLDENSKLCFFKDSNQTGIITNTLMVNSSHSEFNFKFNIETTELPEKSKKYKRRTSAEAFVFLFGPRLYDVNTFSKSSTVMDAMGVGLVFTRPKAKDKQLVFLKEYHTSSNLINIQSSYKEKYFKKYSCEVDYMNKTTKLKVDFDFTQGLATFYINDQLCFSYVLNRDVFVEEKISYTFFGYSQAKNPVKIAFDDIMVRKLMAKGSKRAKNTFHSSPKTVIEVLNVLFW